MSIKRLPQHDLMFLGASPVVYHCHHFNLFLDQTIGDALGQAKAQRLRRLAGRQAASELLGGVTQSAATPVERLELAKQTFAAMGHGVLNFEVDPQGGQVRSRTLHYGVSWKEKYGQTVKTAHPIDDFAAGFAAAATAIAFGAPGESLDSREVECVARRETRCRFEVTASTDQLAPSAPVTPESIAPFLHPPLTGHREDEIAAVTDGLNQFLAGVQPDERGLFQAFGVYVTLHLSNYYNRISFEALTEITGQDTEFLGAFEDLLRESGHVCVFNTFGGILSSPEWEGLVGAPTGDPEEIVVGCLAIARALGFGRWSLKAFAAGQALEIVTPVNYEAPYFQIRHGAAVNAPEYFFQGAALAIMQLAHRVDWKSKPKFNQQEYQRLFLDDELPWSIAQTASCALGDAHSAVTISAR